MLPRVNRLRGAWGEVADDAVGRGIERPEANLEQLEGTKKLHRGGTRLRREDDNRDVSKESIPVGLLESFAPVAELQFKGTDDRPYLIDKILGRQETGGTQGGGGFPGNGDEVSDPITVDRDLSGQGGTSSGGAMMKRLKGTTVGLGKPQNHLLFGAMSSRVVWQVANRFAEPKFWNQFGAFDGHSSNLDQITGLASNFRQRFERTRQLTAEFGSGFAGKDLRRMMQSEVDRERFYAVAINLHYLMGIAAPQSRRHEGLAALMVKHSAGGLRAMSFPPGWGSNGFWELTGGEYSI